MRHKGIVNDMMLALMLLIAYESEEPSMINHGRYS